MATHSSKKRRVEAARVKHEERSIHWPVDLRDIRTDALALRNPLDGPVLDFFETDHYYTDETGRRNDVSVTTFVSNDATLFRAAKIAKSLSSDDPKKATEKLAKWNATADKGTKAHAFAEILMNNPGTTTKDEMIQVEARQLQAYVDEYMKPRGIEPYRTECVIGHYFGKDKQYLIAGSVDLVVFNRKTGRFGIHDFKCTEKDLEDIKNDEKLTVYSLQLTCYAHILSREYDLDIDYDDLVLVVIHETKPSFKCIPIKKHRVEWCPEQRKVVEKPLREIIAGWFDDFEPVKKRIDERKAEIEKDNLLRKYLETFI